MTIFHFSTSSSFYPFLAHFLFKYSTLYCLSPHFHIWHWFCSSIYLFLEPYGHFYLPRTISNERKAWPMVILTMSVNAFSSKRNELLSACRLIAEQTRQEKGCLGCRLSQDIDIENVINIEETWERRSYLDEHFCSDIFSALLGAVKLLGETHEIRINDGFQTEGLEAVQAARSKEGVGEQ